MTRQHYLRVRFKPHFGFVVMYWPGRWVYYDSTLGWRWPRSA